jgi:hypothetical protein
MMTPIPRRGFLRGAGVALTLPWLEAMSSTTTSVTRAGEMPLAEIPRRSVFTFWGLGLNGREYTPTETGLDYKTTTILKPLDAMRSDFTVISGMHLTHSGGHTGDRCYLTGVNSYQPGCKFRVSADQQIADVIGAKTRYPSLVLGVERGTGFGGATMNTISWSKSGAPLPAENRPHVLFEQLFRAEGPDAIRKREADLAERKSVLDGVKADADRLRKSLGTDDRTRLDEYFASIRDVERRMEEERAWLHKPRPKVEPVNFGETRTLDPQTQAKGTFDYRRYQRLMFDVIALALQTDSTRVISYLARKDNSDGTHCFGYLGNPYGLHEMTHHGEDPDKLKWWTKTDTWFFEDWAYFLAKLKSIREGTGTLLDHTLLAWSSSGGTLNAHNRDNLPVLLCGGQRLGVKHQGHLLKKGVRLGNLWQTMLDRAGVAIPKDFQAGEADGLVKEVIA